MLVKALRLSDLQQTAHTCALHCTTTYSHHGF